MRTSRQATSTIDSGDRQARGFAMNSSQQRWFGLVLHIQDRNPAPVVGRNYPL
jgi:hypothetical protein